MQQTIKYLVGECKFNTLEDAQEYQTWFNKSEENKAKITKVTTIEEEI
jgi:hypothetical protein